MNNEIEVAYCSFEVSKLLKEKGFDVECRWYYDTEFKEYTWHMEYENFRNSEIENGYGKLRFPMISAPTHSVAIEWIRVNFGLWINAFDNHQGKRWQSQVVRLSANSTIQGFSNFKTPQEAIDAALVYTLQKLIK